MRDDDFDDRDDDRPRRRRRPADSGGGGGGMKIALIIVGVVLLVFLLCGGGLALLLIPAVGKVRSAAESAKAQNNLKQIALGLHNYESSYGSLPPPALLTKDGKPGLSWRVAILPFIEQDNLYKQFKLDEPWDSANNLPLSNSIVMTYVNPGDPPTKMTHYRVFIGNGAAFDYEKKTAISRFTDGSSNTILIVESPVDVPWAKPDDIEYHPNGPLPALGLSNRDFALVAMGDGFVRRVSKKCSAASWHAAICSNDGKIPGPDFGQ
jgi:hypothetical protein